MTTTNERVRQTVQRIDAVLAEPETVCLRPGCNATALPWLSPWCTPECLRLHHQATHVVMTEHITTARTELDAEQCQCAVLGHMAPCSWCTNPANPLNAPDSEIATATRELARRIDLAPDETHSVPITGGILFAGPIPREPDRPTWRQRLLNGIRKRPW